MLVDHHCWQSNGNVLDRGQQPVCQGSQTYFSARRVYPDTRSYEVLGDWITGKNMGDILVMSSSEEIQGKLASCGLSSNSVWLLATQNPQFDICCLGAS